MLEQADAARDPYAAAILDHLMPEVDGVELAPGAFGPTDGSPGCACC